VPINWLVYVAGGEALAAEVPERLRSPRLRRLWARAARAHVLRCGCAFAADPQPHAEPLIRCAEARALDATTRLAEAFAATVPEDPFFGRLDELVAATGVSDRNLLNWCAAGFVPRPMRHFLGPRGTAAFYRAESVAMIRRLYELQRQGRDADVWLWGLWLDSADYPIDIRPWILGRLDHALKVIKAIGDDADELERHVAGALKPGDPRR
jgi:hypothetical protein